MRFDAAFGQRPTISPVDAVVTKCANKMASPAPPTKDSPAVAELWQAHSQLEKWREEKLLGSEVNGQLHAAQDRYQEALRRVHSESQNQEVEFEGYRKASMRDLMHEFLIGLDETIAERLRRGERSVNVVAAADFKNGLALTQIPGYDPTFAAGSVMDLPVNHPLALWPKMDLLDKHRLVLGVADHALLNNRPRPFYLTSTVRMWTARARNRQIQRMIENALAAGASQIRELKEREGIDCEAPHRPTQWKVPDRRDVLKEFDSTGSEPWCERFIQAINSGMDSRKVFTTPAEDVTLDELLQVRLACGVEDHETRPIQFAACRMAALVAGPARNSDLRNALLDAARVIVPRIERELSKGLIRAALSFVMEDK
jgi:hypothetical protein